MHYLVNVCDRVRPALLNISDELAPLQSMCRWCVCACCMVGVCCMIDVMWCNEWMITLLFKGGRKSKKKERISQKHHTLQTTHTHHTQHIWHYIYDTLHHTLHTTLHHTQHIPPQKIFSFFLFFSSYENKSEIKSYIK